MSYRGTSFPGGYESQTNLSAPTVRGVLTARLSEMLGVPTSSLGLAVAGRTDAGVSAKANLFSFVSRTPIEIDKFVENLNCKGGDMRAHTVVPVERNFHARFGTRGREYLYVLPLVPEVCGTEAAAYAHAINTFLESVVGESLDYFGMSKGHVKNSNCTLESASCWCYNSSGTVFRPTNQADGEAVSGFGQAWRTVIQDNEKEHCLVFRFRANRFIRRMVRKTINSLLLEADHVISKDFPNNWPTRWKEQLKQRDRSGNTPAPSEGLCMWRVYVQ